MEANARTASRIRASLAHWLPVLAWVGTITYFSSVPDPYGQFRDQATTATDLLAHMGGFVILMLLVGRLARFLAGAAGVRPLVWGLLACWLYGAADEFHQRFIPGRGFEWIDMAANGVGAAVGAVVVLAYGRMRGRRGS